MEKIRTIKQFNTLYSKNSKGEILEWAIKVTEWVDDANRYHYKIVTNSGLYAKSLSNVPNVTDITVGKNLGKANETTPLEQAILEATSKWNYKINRHGYFDIFSSAKELNIDLYSPDLLEELKRNLPQGKNTEGYIIPMKAQQFYKKAKRPCSSCFGKGTWEENELGTNTCPICKGKKKEDTLIPTIDFPCYGQPKINGYRATITYDYSEDQVIILSKNGVRFRIPHIEKEYKIIFNAIRDNNIEFNEDLVLDGELYIPNTILSDITSAVSTTVKGSGNLLTGTLKHYLFDYCDSNNFKFPHRLDYLERLKELISKNYTINSVVFVETVNINNLIIAEKFRNSCIELGYEGAVYRSKSNTYEAGKRPKTMVKWKKLFTSEFIILDIVPMANQPNLGQFLCKNDINENTFEVVSLGTHFEKAEFLKNKESYIGKKLEVQFYERTTNGLPFHAVGIRIREDFDIN